MTKSGPSNHSEPWQRVAELYERASVLDPTSRDSFLEEACGSNDDLRAEVESLLQFESRAEGFLDSPGPFGMSESLNRHQADSLIGTRLGSYELVDVLGYGGMGVVYRARQDHTQREVAVKVVRGGGHLDGRRLRLFDREVRTLARLRHPAIASIHEAGSTEDGRHFFAMELVDGTPLNRYLADVNPSTTDRLALFRLICDAINYAHQRGVIHRDIKPSNILIDPRRQPKVLDFGLAKITDSDLSVTSMQTEIGKIQGTLAYMSPEQARGRSDDIDLRSDVYSLGVVLYEMITGQTPYNLKDVPLPEVVRMICDQPPTKLSTIQRSLGGDLETIILKALEKEPERRYQSGAALSDDLERFQTNQPILARPPSASYQLRKLAARHKVPFALGVLLFVAIVAFGLISSLQAYRITAQARQLAGERNQAIEARARESESRLAAEEVARFLEDLFQRADPELGLGADPGVREVLADAATKIDSSLTDQPLVRARLMEILGSVHRKLGDFDRSGELLRNALHIRESELDDEHAELVPGLFALGELLAERGEYDAAETQLRRALTIRVHHFGEEDIRVAEAWERLGATCLKAQRFADAVEHFRKSLDILGHVRPPDHLDVLRVKDALGQALGQTGDYERADSLLREVLAIRQDLGDGRLVAETLSSLAQVAWDRGDPPEAERFSAEHVDTLRRACRDDDPAVSSALNDYAAIVRQTHGPAAAVPLLREALAIDRAVYGDQHLVVAKSMGDLGMSLMEQNDFEAAQDLFKKALAIYRELLTDTDDRVAICLNNLARAYQNAGQYDQAEPLLLEALQQWQQLYGDDAPRVGIAMLNLGALMKAKSDPATAENYYRSAVEIYRKDNHPNLASAYNQIGSLALSQGDFAKAEEYFRLALELWQSIPQRVSVVAIGLNNVGTALRELGRAEEAEPLLREAVGQYRDRYESDNTRLISPLTNLAAVLVDTGDIPAAEQLYAEALAIARNRLPPDGALLRYVLFLYGELKFEQGNLEVAELMLREAAQSYQKFRPPGFWESLRATSALGACLLAQVRPAEAEPLLKQVVEHARVSLPKQHWHTGLYLGNYALCLVRLERFEDAEPLLLEAYEMMRTALGVDHRRTIRIVESLVELYRDWGLAEPGKDLEQKSMGWRTKLTNPAEPGG